MKGKLSPNLKKEKIMNKALYYRDKHASGSCFRNSRKKNSKKVDTPLAISLNKQNFSACSTSIPQSLQTSAFQKQEKIQIQSKSERNLAKQGIRNEKENLQTFELQLSPEGDPKRKKLADYCYKIKLISKMYALWKAKIKINHASKNCVSVQVVSAEEDNESNSKETIGTIELLEQSLDKYERISQMQIPATQNRTQEDDSGNAIKEIADFTAVPELKQDSISDVTF